MKRINYFNPLRTEYYVSGRTMYLHDNLSIGSILFGYAIESMLKETLLFAGNTKHKLQHSHDLKVLFNACLDKGIFTSVEVPSDFIDFSNSLFQMRYPSTQISESLKAYDRNKTIGLTKSYLFCYDDFFRQLDEAFFQVSQEPYSSSILRVFAGLQENKRHFGLYFNSAVLQHYELYKERINKFFAPNKSAIKLLENNAEFFWSDGYNYNIYADLNHYSKNRELLKFKFPGNVIRDKDGNITHLEF